MLPLPEQDVENISRLLADVTNWKGLAGSLNIRNNDIVTDCTVEQARAACYRRELVRRYCDRQLSDNPSKVAEDIAKALELMDHKRQAQKLRELQFSESVVSCSNTHSVSSLASQSRLIHHLLHTHSLLVRLAQ